MSEKSEQRLRAKKKRKKKKISEKDINHKEGVKEEKKGRRRDEQSKKSTSGYEKSLSRRSNSYTNLKKRKRNRGKKGPMSMRIFWAPRLAS
jgi:hypothetical protein